MTNFVIRRLGEDVFLDITGIKHILVTKSGTRAEIQLSEGDVMMLREALR